MSAEISEITERNHAETRVPFGPEPHQHLPASKAGELLTLLRNRDPKRFGDALLLVMLGPEAVRGRGHSGSNGSDGSY